jgi:hypothetical protein
MVFRDSNRSWKQLTIRDTALLLCVIGPETVLQEESKHARANPRRKLSTIPISDAESTGQH